MRNLTPAHLRCDWGGCPSVHELEDGKLLIVGETAEGPDLETAMKVADWSDRETAIIIDKALLATIRDEVREECAKALCRECRNGDAPCFDEAAKYYFHRCADGGDIGCTASAIRALKETRHE